MMDEQKEIAEDIVYDDNYLIKSEKKKNSKDSHKKETKEEKESKEDKKEEKEDKKETKEEKKETKKESKSKKSDSKKKPKVEKKDNTITYISILAIILIFAIMVKTGKISLPDSPNSPVTDSAIAATVNDEKIMMSDIDAIYNTIPEQLKLFYTKDKIIEQEITNTLLLQEAKKANVVVTDAETDQAMADLLERVGGAESLEEALVQYGVTEDELKDNLKTEILIRKFLNTTVYPGITVTEDELDTYYVENLDQFTVPERITASHILICFEGKEDCTQNRTRNEALTLFKKIVTELDSGKDFAEAAMEYSDDPTAPLGGNLGQFERGRMIKSFEMMAFSLKPGQYNKVATETMYGYHIILVTDKQEAGSIPLNDVKDSLKNQIKTEKEKIIFDEYLADIKADADIRIMANQEITLANPCIEDYSMSSDTVLFVSSDKEWCNYCQKMKPIVSSVKATGANIVTINYDDQEDNVVKGCYSANLAKGAPQFICAGSGESIVGTVSQERLTSFAANCN